MVGFLLLAAAAWFALFGGDWSLFELQRIRREQQQETVRLEQARIEAERLRARVDSLETDSATIERVARERWGLIRPGERLYRFERADSLADSLRARMDSLERSAQDTSRL